MSKESTFVSLLSSIATVRASVKPENLTDNVITYMNVDTNPHHFTDLSRGLSEQRFQFNCYGKTPEKSKALADQVIAMLDGLESFGDIQSCQLSGLKDSDELESKGLHIHYVDFLIR